MTSCCAHFFELVYLTSNGVEINELTCYVCVCVCVHARTCVCVHARACMRGGAYVCMHVCVCVCVHARVMTEKKYAN